MSVKLRIMLLEKYLKNVNLKEKSLLETSTSLNYSTHINV